VTGFYNYSQAAMAAAPLFLAHPILNWCFAVSPLLHDNRAAYFLGVDRTVVVVGTGSGKSKTVDPLQAKFFMTPASIVRSNRAVLTLICPLDRRTNGHCNRSRLEVIVVETDLGHGLLLRLCQRR
jgi:hypothetical protein